VLVYIAGGNPQLTFLPGSWHESISSRFPEQVTRIKNLTCAGTASGAQRKRPTGGSYTNRISRGDFLSSCSAEARTLIEQIGDHLGPAVKMVFGGSTMTVNRRPQGALLRISRKLNSIEDLDPAVDAELVGTLQRAGFGTLQRAGLRSTFEIEATPEFCSAVVEALARTLAR